MARCKFQEGAAEVSFGCISFHIVTDGLGRGCKPIMVIIAADEGS